MAYEALNSLARQIDSILIHQNTSHHTLVERGEFLCHLVNKQAEIQCLQEDAIFLPNFLQDFPGEAANFEAQLTNTLKRAHDSLKRYGIVGNGNVTDSMKSIEEETDSLLKEAKWILNSSRSFYFSPKLNNTAKETIVRLEKDLIEIKGRLFGEPSSPLEIIPIVGMGGIGKTTLARYTYKDPSSFHHFDVRAWATVSQKSSEEILSSLLSCIDPNDKGCYQWFPKELLVQKIYKYLKRRRYLITMDDMCDTNVWDDVRRAFPNDCNGSRIIITTRDLDVSFYVDSLKKPHKIQLMPADQSWSLLKEGVFGQGTCPPELEKIGESIAEKCRGLPLAIVVIAGVLSKLGQEQESWKNIDRNVSQALNTSSDEKFLDILSVSYMHLPLHLRPCFLFMACFPEDYEIDVSRLIMLWVAEGFLESTEMEELGYEYLENLASRSLVLIEKKWYNGKIKTVKIHDVLRDLCIRKSRDENFHHIINEFEGSFQQGIEISHRLSICANVSGFIPNMERSPTHTILLFKNWAFDFWKDFRLLRVVHALSIRLGSRRFNSHGSIGELIHLRYLAFTCEPTRGTLRLVSESLYKLQNLQTLIIFVERPEFKYLSVNDEDLYQRCMNFEMWRMPQLRQLILLDGFIPDTDFCTDDVLALENLHSLSRIRDFKFSERVLQMIPNIKKLGISYSYKKIYETGWSEYGLNNLIHLHKLEKLSLYAEPYPNLKNDSFTENISFPVTIKKLTLSGCGFPWEEMSMIGALPNLEMLKLKRRACCGTVWETREGEFCQLKVIVIQDSDLHEWIADELSFPSLQRLTLFKCHSLKEVPNGIGDIPTLELIEVDIQNLSVAQSVKCIENEQESVGNDLLQVRFLNSGSWET